MGVLAYEPRPRRATRRFANTKEIDPSCKTTERKRNGYNHRRDTSDGTLSRGPLMTHIVPERKVVVSRRPIFSPQPGQSGRPIHAYHSRRESSFQGVGFDTEDHSWPGIKAHAGFGNSIYEFLLRGMCSLETTPLASSPLYSQQEGKCADSILWKRQTSEKKTDRSKKKKFVYSIAKYPGRLNNTALVEKRLRSMQRFSTFQPVKQ